MNMRRLRLTVSIVLVAVVVVGILISGVLHSSEPILTKYTLQKIAGEFTRPTAIVQPPGDANRLFVAEQTGTVRIIERGQVLPTPFLDITTLLTSKALEQGLLDIAFHPKYATNGLFFITYTDTTGTPVLARYHVSANDPNRADPASAKIILTIPHPWDNHNGGQIQFGPDGYLYYGMGDGGSEGDPQGNGQKKNTMLASMLRLDIDHGDPYAIPPDNPFVHDPAYLPEIWAKGLRNPWRFSFDQKTGDLYIGDVGGSLQEEVDFQPASSKGGENYGWNLYEGNIGTSNVTGLTFPIITYDHVTGGCAIVGGYVYRGKSLPTLDGTYLYGDWCRGTIWSLKRDPSGTWLSEGLLSSGLSITTFGQANDGEIYVGDYKGGVYQLTAQKH